jgi:hypothetical protein
LVGVQLTPPVQASHVPLVQNRFVPHAWPLGATFPVSVHAWVAQLRVPVWHAFDEGVQASPVVHSSHSPPTQTS